MPPKGHSKKGGGYYGETEAEKYIRSLLPGYKGPQTRKPDLFGLGTPGPTNKFGPVLVPKPKKKKKKVVTPTGRQPTTTNNTVTVKPKKKKDPVVEPIKKKPLSLADYLRKDVDYQDQMRGFDRTLSQFLAEATRQKGKIAGETQAGVNKLGIQRGRDLTGIKDDFSGRGVLFSGMYGNRLGEYEQDYQTALGDINRQKSNLLGDISAEQSRFQSEQAQAKEQAKKDAVRRRAAKSGS